MTVVAVTAVDTDGDGIADEVDAYPTIDLGALIDSDGDGAPNACDSSCQSLGMAVDAFPNNANEWLDTDSDGLGNNSDTDDDGDGISDAQDDFPLDASESTDTDGDGIGDNTDLDDDNDGVADTADPFPKDTDDDGTDNAFDLDDDNDGVFDNDDIYPLVSILGFFLIVMPMAHQIIAIPLALLRASARTPTMIMTAFLISTTTCHSMKPPPSTLMAMDMLTST